jgi:formylmethanofuran dehydrogenase subunit E
MTIENHFPDDFMECVRFHGHVCPGLAIGYAAARIGARFLGIRPSEDEEIVAIAENDSCAVDAVQVLLGCTFGKGNLIFRDWGKQVFTFVDRKSGRGVRVSFRGRQGKDDSLRRSLKKRIDSGEATSSEHDLWHKLRHEAVLDLITSDPSESFDVCEVGIPEPAYASIVSTEPCDVCGEATMSTRLVTLGSQRICRDCAEKEK